MAWKQAQNRRKRLVRCYKQTWHGGLGGVWYDEKEGRYHRYTYNMRWAKRYANRIFRRRHVTYGGKGNIHKKEYDYIWTVF